LHPKPASFSLATYPRGIQDDRSRVSDSNFDPKIIPGGITNATDEQVRAGAMGMRKFAQDEKYEAWNDNCGAAVRVGLQAAGSANPPDYENKLILNTVRDPVIQSTLRVLFGF